MSDNARRRVTPLRALPILALTLRCSARQRRALKGEALALFKLACILEGSYARLVAGNSEHEGHRTYETLVPRMVGRAVDIVAGRFTVE